MVNWELLLVAGQLVIMIAGGLFGAYSFLFGGRVQRLLRGALDIDLIHNRLKHVDQEVDSVQDSVQEVRDNTEEVRSRVETIGEMQVSIAHAQNTGEKVDIQRVQEEVETNSDAVDSFLEDDHDWVGDADDDD